MSLNRTAYVSALVAAFEANIPSPTPEQINAFNTLAESIADATIVLISSGTFVYTSGLIAPSGGGPVTAPAGIVGNIQ